MIRRSIFIRVSILCDRMISNKKDKENIPLTHRPYLGPWWDYRSWVTYCRCRPADWTAITVMSSRSLCKSFNLRFFWFPTVVLFLCLPFFFLTFSHFLDMWLLDKLSPECVQCRRGMTHNVARVRSVFCDSVSQFSDLREQKRCCRSKNIMVSDQRSVSCGQALLY